MTATDLVTDPVVAAMTSTCVGSLRRSPEFRRADPRDLRQELVCGLLVRFRRFDPTRGHLRAWAGAALKSVSTDMVRAARRQKRQGDRRALPLHQLVRTAERPLGRLRTGAASAIDRLVEVEAVGTVMSRLPPRLQVLCRAVEPGRQGALSRSGLSRRAFDRQYAELIDQFRNGGYEVEAKSAFRAQLANRRRTSKGMGPSCPGVTPCR